jgi:hypothetical protein
MDVASKFTLITQFLDAHTQRLFSRQPGLLSGAAGTAPKGSAGLDEPSALRKLDEAQTVHFHRK